MTTPGRTSNDRSSTAAVSLYLFVNPRATIMRHFPIWSGAAGRRSLITVPAVEHAETGSATIPGTAETSSIGYRLDRHGT